MGQNLKVDVKEPSNDQMRKSDTNGTEYEGRC